MNVLLPLIIAFVIYVVGSVDLATKVGAIVPVMPVPKK